MSEPSPRSSLVRWLYTHNPFYAISAALMLYAVRAGYGKLQIGSINCWVMMGVLAAYTLLLAGVGVCIVRLGRVWEDARSILLLLLLFFLAVSISADDLFVKAATPGEGTALLVSGFLFSVAVSAGVIWGSRIRIGWEYAVPFVLYLALFFAMPWWCSPELHPRATRLLNWTVFLFPQVAALLNLTLLQAVRRGAKGVANNGTPWPWPWFPWTAFGVIAVAVVIRSFALAMTFGQTGPIWGDIKARSGIVFDTIWGPYFLIPFGLSVLLLLFEGALAAGNQVVARKTMLFSPSLLLLALPWSSGGAFQSFLIGKVTATIGSPLWWTTLLLLVFFGWALLRKVAGASVGFVSMIALLAFVGADTISLRTIGVAHPAPLFVAGTLLAITAAIRKSSAGCFAASAVLISALWLVLPATPIAAFRMTTCYHLLLLCCVLFGLIFRDRFSTLLRLTGAAWLPLTSLAMMSGYLAGDVPISWKLLYVFGATAICFNCAMLSHSKWYLYASTISTAVLGYGLMMLGFRRAASLVGSEAMTALSWSVATLLIGVLISAHKAQWLPKWLSPNWSNGHGRKLAPAGDSLEGGGNQPTLSLAEADDSE